MLKVDEKVKKVQKVLFKELIKRRVLSRLDFRQTSFKLNAQKTLIIYNCEKFRPVIAESALAVTVALAAVAPVDGVAEVAVATSLAVSALGVVATRLLAHPHPRPRHITRAVPVTLTRGTRGEVPLLLPGDLTRVRGKPLPWS